MTVPRLPREGCERVREMAPDLALGLLTGVDRGDALAHLQRCESCRAEVAALSGTADEVLLAAPEATPPEGFDRRVLAAVAAHRASECDGPGDRVGAPHRGHGWRPAARLVALTLAASLLVVAGLAAAMLRDGGGGRDDRGDDPVVAAAEMRTGRGRTVGEVTVTGDRPVAVTVAVPEWTDLVERWEDEAAGGYWLAVETRDGERTMLPMTTADGDGWTVSVDAAHDDIATVSVVDGEGRTWCTGTFPA